MMLTWKLLFGKCMQMVSNFYLDARRNLRVFFHLFRILMISSTESLSKIFSEFMIILIRFGLLMCLYYYLFQFKGGVINGETLQTVAWSMYFSFAYLALNPRRQLTYQISKDIKSGTIEIMLSKPVNYIVYIMSLVTGNKVYAFLINTAIGVAAMLYIFGVPDILYTFEFWVSFPVVFILCLILSSLIYSLIGLLAFWLEEVYPITQVFDKIIMVFSGGYFPIVFFTGGMKAFAVYSPFGASQFISHTVYSSWPETYIKMIGIQVFWILTLSIIMYLLFGLAIKKLSVNGG